MSRASNLAKAIGADGTLNVSDVAGLAAVASSGSASDLSTGTLPIARIADGAVTSAKIADGTIATGDIADGAVTSAKIADATIATGDIADSAITAAKIASSAVTSAKLASGTAVANIGFTPVNNNDWNVSVWTGTNLATGSPTIQTDSWGWGDGESFNNCYLYLVAWNTNSVSGYTGATSTAMFLEYGPYRSRIASANWNTTTDIVEYTNANFGARGFRFNNVDVATNKWSVYRINLLY